MTITLTTGGARYDGWTGFTVTWSLTEAAAAFTLSVTERWAGQGERWQIERGADCGLALDGEPLIGGYVDRRQLRYDAQSVSVVLTGRSKTCDLVDCSALVPGGQFRGYDLLQIARALAAPFGIAVRAEAPVGAPFADVQIQQGESCFEVIERLCRLRGLLASCGPGGDLILARAGAERAAIALREGVNILAGEAAFADDKRFSDYVVRGQQAGSDDLYGAAAAEVEGLARDSAVARYRPLLVVAEAQVDGAAARERALWQAKTRAAQATQASITLQGFRQGAGGPLWRPNLLVAVTSPRLDLDEPTELLVSAVSFSLSERGSLTTLTLVPPEALTPEPARDAGSGGGAAAGGLWSEVQAIR